MTTTTVCLAILAVLIIIISAQAADLWYYTYQVRKANKWLNDLTTEIIEQARKDYESTMAVIEKSEQIRKETEDLLNKGKEVDND